MTDSDYRAWRAQAAETLAAAGVAEPAEHILERTYCVPLRPLKILIERLPVSPGRFHIVDGTGRP